MTDPFWILITCSLTRLVLTLAYGFSYEPKLKILKLFHPRTTRRFTKAHLMRDLPCIKTLAVIATAATLRPGKRPAVCSKMASKATGTLYIYRLETLGSNLTNWIRCILYNGFRDDFGRMAQRPASLASSKRSKRPATNTVLPQMTPNLVAFYMRYKCLVEEDETHVNKQKSSALTKSTRVQHDPVWIWGATVTCERSVCFSIHHMLWKANASSSQDDTCHNLDKWPH